MRVFLRTALGPKELETIDKAFDSWRIAYQIPKDSPDAEIAAAIIMNLYREGHDTQPALEAAMSKHRGLADLTDLSFGS